MWQTRAELSCVDNFCAAVHSDKHAMNNTGVTQGPPLKASRMRDVHDWHINGRQSTPSREFLLLQNKLEQDVHDVCNIHWAPIFILKEGGLLLLRQLLHHELQKQWARHWDRTLWPIDDAAPQKCMPRPVCLRGDRQSITASCCTTKRWNCRRATGTGLYRP